MDFLPEDIQYLIWKKVYNGCLNDIHNKAYLGFAERRLNTLRKEQLQYDLYYWQYIRNLNKRFMNTMPMESLRRTGGKILRRTSKNWNAEKHIALMMYEKYGMSFCYEMDKEEEATNARTLNDYMYENWNMRGEFW